MVHLPTLLLFVVVGQADVPAVRLPQPAPVPAPVPVPVPPLGPTTLSTNQLYIIDADVSCIVMASPPGLLSLTAETGPIKIRGQFVDGQGTETRTYKGKFVYIVEAAGTGRCELLIVPAGALQARDVLRRFLDVNGGPSPPPPPPPQPNDTFVTDLRAAFVADGSKSAPQLAALYRLVASQVGTDTSLKTYGDLFALLKKAQDGLVNPATIVKARAVIGAELLRKLGNSASAPIDRTLTAQTFVRIATALEAVP